MSPCTSFDEDILIGLRGFFLEKSPEAIRQVGKRDGRHGSYLSERHGVPVQRPEEIRNNLWVAAFEHVARHNERRIGRGIFRDVQCRHHGARMIERSRQEARHIET